MTCLILKPEKTNFAHWKLSDAFHFLNNGENINDNYKLTSTSCPRSGSLERIAYIKADEGIFSGTDTETPTQSYKPLTVIKWHMPPYFLASHGLCKSPGCKSLYWVIS